MNRVTDQMTDQAAAPRIDRRTALRLLGGAGLALALPLLRPAGEAAAGITWCRADPIVRLGGTRVQFWVSVPEDKVQYVTGPIACRVHAPANVEKILEYTDSGFHGYGETVVFGDAGHDVQSNRSFPVSIRVDVPNSLKGNKFPIIVDIIPENGDPIRATGNAGSTTVKLKITPSN